MKPTLNYGLSDSLIDVVRKAVKEAKLHSNQQKLDVHEPEKDELTSQDFKKLRAGKKVKDGIDTKPKLKEEEQIDELSVNKMLKYTDAANKNREVLNKKWDTGTATEKEKNKVLGHEAGVDRAAARVKAKTGKNPNEIGKLSRMKYAVTKEEEQMDETEEQIDELSRGTLKSYVKKAIKSAKHYSFEPAVRDPKSGNQYRPTYTKRSKGIDLAKDKLKREDVEQMDESLDSIAKKHDMKYTTTAYGAGMKHPTKGEISINRYGEWHHKGTNKTGDSENDFSSLDKHLSTVKEEEQMDEAPLRAVNALVGYPKLYKKVPAKGTPGSEDERNKAAAGLKRDRSGLGRRAYTGDQHYDVRREEVEQMDEVKLADLKVRNIAGTRYGGGAERDPYKDPEGADDAWEKERFSKKRKSGSQGPMKRRSPFNAKSAQRLGKLPTQY